MLGGERTKEEDEDDSYSDDDFEKVDTTVREEPDVQSHPELLAVIRESANESQ